MTGQLITLPFRLYARGARLVLHAAEDVTGKAVMNTLRVAGALGNLRPGGGGAVTSTRPATPARATPEPEREPTPAPEQEPTPEPEQERAAEPTPEPAPDPRATTPPRRAGTNGAGTSAPRRPAPAAAPEGGNGAPPPLASERLEQEGRTVSIDLDAPPAATPDHVSEDPVLVREEAEPGAEDGVGATISVQEPWEGYGRMPARDVVARLAAASTAELAAVQLYESSHRKRQTVLAAVQRELTTPGR